MEVRQLRYFVAIADFGGFARAAKACHITQPAISASIAQLEAVVGTPLFDRGSFGARPTAAGRALLDRARLILSEVERAQSQMRALVDGAGGSISIGVGPLFEHTIMPGVLAAFVARRPRVHIAAITGLTGDLHARVASGELDLAVSSPPNHGEGHVELETEVLERTHDVVVAAGDHRLWRADELSLALLSSFPWVVSARVSSATQAFMLAFANAGVEPPRTIVRTDSIPILRSLVLTQGFMCIASPHFAAYRSDSRSAGADFGELRAAEVAAFAFPRSLCLATRARGLLTPVTKELIDDIKRAARSIVE